MNTDSENIKLARQERERYLHVLNDQTEQLDKYVILASGTLFNVSLVFVDRIVPLNAATHIWAFTLALILLAVAFFATLGSFWASATEAERSIAAMDECISEDSDPRGTHQKYQTIWTRGIYILNNMSFLFLFIAMLLLTFFIVFNVLEQGNSMSKKNEVIMATDGKPNILPPPKHNPSDSTRGKVNVPPPPTSQNPSSDKVVKK